LAVGIGAIPLTAAGGVVGAAVYGAFQGKTTVVTAMGVGAVGGVGVYNFVGGMGIVAPKIGLAMGIGAVPMAGIGAVVGLAAVGITKLLGESEVKETPIQLFDRMEEKVLQMDYYNAAMEELNSFLLGDELNQKFAALEIENELEALKGDSRQSKQDSTVESKVTNITNESPQSWKCAGNLTGHTAGINAIAVHPDGNTFMTGGNDKQVNVWNLRNQKWVYTFSGQEDAVLAVAISPDGKQLISGGVDRKITSWDLGTRKFNRTFFYLNSPYSHNGFINSLAYSPDGATIASGSSDKTIRLWGRYTGELKRILNGHTEAVLSVAISPDSKTLVSGSADKTIRVWNLQTGKERIVLSQHLAAVNTVVITPDNQTIISGSTDSQIHLWNLESGELRRSLTGHSRGVFSLSISPDGKILASSSNDGMIQLWHLPNGELWKNLSGYSPISFGFDGKTLLSCDKGAGIKILQYQPSYEKDIYRKIAKLVHPDLGRDASQKEARTLLMMKINQAYEDENIDEMLRLFKSLKGNMPSEEEQIESELEKLRQWAAKNPVPNPNPSQQFYKDPSDEIIAELEELKREMGMG